MDIIKLILATFVGTTLMTAFSYLMSSLFGRVYKEPKLLNYLLHQLGIDMRDNTKKIIGWLLHYIIGFGFVLIYEILWSHFFELTWLTATIFGMGSGIIGIVSWFFMFRIPHTTPKIDYKGFYIQLFFAHVIFGIGVIIVYKLYS